MHVLDEKQDLMSWFLSEAELSRFGAWAKAFGQLVLEGCLLCEAASRQLSCCGFMPAALCQEKGWAGRCLSSCAC